MAITNLESERRLRVALMTRLRTQNAGNEALSSLLIRFVKRSLPDAEVRCFDRGPLYMGRYCTKSLGADPGQAVERFEGIVDNLHRMAMQHDGKDLAALATEALVSIRRNTPLRSPLMTWYKATVRPRARLASMGLVDFDAMKRMLQTLRWCDVVVWNPAGELHPRGSTDEALQLLLVVRLAQRLGKRTAIINHSLEAVDPVINALITHVYAGAGYVSVRESGSVKRGLELGIRREVLHEVPDLVFLLANPAESSALDGAPTTKAAPEGTVFLSINGLEAHRGGDGWGRLFEGLREAGRPLAFLTNAMNDDIPFAREHATAFSVPFLLEQPGYVEIARSYRGAGVLVSSRLHASILALCVGTPVVSIEPQLFKLTATFEQLGYPVPTVAMHESGWADRVLAGVDQVFRDRDRVVDAGRRGIETQMQAVEKGCLPLWRMAREALQP